MAKTKEQKGEVIQKLEHAFKNASSSVFVHFTKVTVAEESAMRRALHNLGISYVVAKKTLMRRALDTLKLDHASVPLKGEVAVAYDAEKDGDPTAVARHIWGFVKQLKDEKLSILGGIFEGRFVGSVEMSEIATIPPVPVLRGMFLNVINSPIQGLVVALSAIAEKKGTN